MTDATQPTPNNATQKAERIAKRMARAGISSRRGAEAMIADGRVTVNGTLLTSPAHTVTPDDIIMVDGKALPAAEPTRLWRYYKPRGLIVSNKDEQNRDTIYDHLPDDLPRLISVGRLDLDTEGLLLLTNDGELARYLELPSTAWIRKYRVRVRGIVDAGKLERLANGISIDGIHYGEIKARLDKQMPSNAWLTIAIKEGKNREIRQVMEHLGYTVSRLLRLSYGPFQLGKMTEASIEEVKPAILKEQLGSQADAFMIKLPPKDKQADRRTDRRPSQQTRTHPKAASHRRRQQPSADKSQSDKHKDEHNRRRKKRR
ncbi:MAG: pseudouridine synthase [Candidatus Puniceispirillaceae bacterium]